MRALNDYSLEAVKQKIDESSNIHCEELKAMCLELAQALAKDKKDPKYLGIPNISFSLVAPDDDRDEDFRKQRLERGFDGSELWSLKDTITNFILPRLKAFAGNPCGYPGCFDSPDEWDEILGKMIRAFEISQKEECGILTDEEGEEFDEGIALFGEYFFHLWT